MASDAVRLTFDTNLSYPLLLASHAVFIPFFSCYLLLSSPLIPPIRPPSRPSLLAHALVFLLLPLLLLVSTTSTLLRISLLISSVAALRISFTPQPTLRIALAVYYVLLIFSLGFLPLLPLLTLCVLRLHPTSISHSPPNSASLIPRNPRNASLLTLLMFDWVTPLMVTATRRPLEHADVPQMSAHFVAETSVNRFYCQWRTASNASNRSLTRTLIRLFAPRSMCAVVFKLLVLTCTLASPLILQQILLRLQSQTPQSATLPSVRLALLLFLLYILNATFSQQYYDNAHTTQAQLRGALLSAVYSKTTLLTTTARCQFSTGQIQNMMSTDCRTIAAVPTYIHDLWSAAIQAVLSFLLLITILGWQPAVVSLGCIALFFPVQAALVYFQTKANARMLRFTDERVKFVSEAIRSIKLIKLYAWEPPILHRIEEQRKRELECFKHIGYLYSGNHVLIWTLYVLQIMACMLTYVFVRGPLTPAIIFPALALFRVFFPALIQLPSLVSSLAQALTSLGRISAYLEADELDVDGSLEHADQELSLNSTGFDIVADDLTVSWDLEAEAVPILENVSLKVPKGALVAVVGATGCGKTTLLKALLGEAQLQAGHVFVRNRQDGVAYCDQIPFIQNATLKENILFGKPLDEDFYRSVLHVSCLEKDLESLPAGDKTEIGSRGINLSGGQRARVAVARAVYSKKSICVWDDPFSAVDSFVGNTLFHSCLVDLLQGHTRVFTTNHLKFASHHAVDMVVVISDGHVVEVASPAELMQNEQSHFWRMVHSARAKPTENGSVSSGDREDSPILVNGTGDEQKRNHENRENSSETSKLLTDQRGNGYGSTKTGKLTTVEEREAGRVKLQYYQYYLMAVGFFQGSLPILVFTFAEQGFELAATFWLSLWSDVGTLDGMRTYVTMIVILSCCAIVTDLFSDLCSLHAIVRASTALHDRLLLSVFGAPMQFFNSVPDGRLINRFSSDIDKMDSNVGPSVLGVLGMLTALFYSCGLILWALPPFIIMLGIVTIICFILQDYYRKAVVDLRRLESLAYSPLYSHFGETIDGVCTLRAYSDIARAKCENSKFVDGISRTVYANSLTRRWFSMRIMNIGAFLILIATVMAIYTPNNVLSAGIKGLVLMHTISMFNMMKQTVKTVTIMEAQFNAVERIAEYSDENFMQEESGDVVAKRLEAYSGMKSYNEKKKANTDVEMGEVTSIGQARKERTRERAWPRNGSVTFERVEMRYREDLAPALKGVSFNIEPHEHIGIVGRTGAGKTSVVQCLFRLYELTKGRILVDGIDISALPLDMLRSGFGVIPQEPVCFSGTIRSNLDMFGEYSDEEVERALTMCGLRECSTRNVNLGDEVSENGSNLSVGQRQLLCLGRVLLKDCKVLVLDEATSSVSMEIDQQIQKVLANEMKHCTVLTVAHRLQTVLQCDRIMVMDNGRVVEIGPPNELLCYDSRLKALVAEVERKVGSESGG